MKHTFIFPFLFSVLCSVANAQPGDSIRINMRRDNQLYFIDGIAVYPSVTFERDSLLIRADTASFFALIDKNYTHSESNNAHRELIKSEVRYRISQSVHKEAKMNGMNLHCYTDKERRAYTAACLNYDEPWELLYAGQAKVFYKNPLREIKVYRIQTKGSKLVGHIDRLYIDQKTGKVFLKEMIYRYKWWRPHQNIEN